VTSEGKGLCGCWLDFTSRGRSNSLVYLDPCRTTGFCVSASFDKRPTLTFSSSPLLPSPSHTFFHFVETVDLLWASCFGVDLESDHPTPHPPLPWLLQLAAALSLQPAANSPSFTNHRVAGFERCPHFRYRQKRYYILHQDHNFGVTPSFIRQSSSQPAITSIFDLDEFREKGHERIVKSQTRALHLTTSNTVRALSCTQSHCSTSTCATIGRCAFHEPRHC
jgi:hypothetical protein